MIGRQNDVIFRLNVWLLNIDLPSQKTSWPCGDRCRTKKKMLVGRRWSFHKYFLYVYIFFFFCFFVARGPIFFWVFGVSFRERLAQPSPTQWLSDRGENGRPRGGRLSVVTWRDGWHYMKSLLIARDPLQWLITSIHRHNHIFMEFQQGFVILWLIVCHIVPIRILTMAY